MGKSIDEGCRGVAHTKYIFFLSHPRAKADGLFFFSPARCHFCTSPESYHWKELSLEVLKRPEEVLPKASHFTEGKKDASEG